MFFYRSVRFFRSIGLFVDIYVFFVDLTFLVLFLLVPPLTAAACCCCRRCLLLLPPLSCQKKVVTVAGKIVVAGKVCVAAGNPFYHPNSMLYYFCSYKVIIIIKGPNSFYMKNWMLSVATMAVIIPGSSYTGPSMNPANVSFKNKVLFIFF